MAPVMRCKRLPRGRGVSLAALTELQNLTGLSIVRALESEADLKWYQRPQSLRSSVGSYMRRYAGLLFYQLCTHPDGGEADEEKTVKRGANCANGVAGADRRAGQALCCGAATSLLTNEPTGRAGSMTCACTWRAPASSSETRKIRRAKVSKSVLCSSVARPQLPM